MKNTTIGLLASIMLIFIISACTKGDLGSAKGQLKATTLNPKINQPDTLVLVGAKTTDSVHWSVIPAGSDSLITKNNTALVFFKKAGNYQVQAVNNGVTTTASFTVSDSVYTNPIKYAYVPITGNITLVPHFHSSPDSSYMVFVAQINGGYCANTYLRYTDSLQNGAYGINFIGVGQPTTCTGGNGPVYAVINFTQIQPSLLSNGTYPFSVTLNGTTYTGSMVVTATNITFNWNYTQGVLIAPQQISR